jgi:hypothetical protein
MEPLKIRVVEKIRNISTENSENDQLGSVTVGGQEDSFVPLMKVKQMFQKEAGAKDQWLYLTVSSDQEQGYKLHQNKFEQSYM